MTTITEDTIRDLAAFEGQGVPVTTCYLDVDGRRLRTQRDMEQELDGLLRQARLRANGTASVHTDLEKIARFVRGGLDRSKTRGLAIFSCSDRGLWEVVRLPRSVRSRVLVNTVPALSQLEALHEDQRRIGVLLVDKQRARMFVFALGELVERSELLDDLPRDYDTRGERERGGVEGHVDALTAQHVRRAADLAFAVYSQHSFEKLCVGAPDDLAGDVIDALHPYLGERLAGRLPVTAGANLDEIRRATVEAEATTERAFEAKLVERLRDAVGSRDRGVAGLEDVLAALSDRRADQLLVSEGYSETGWRCDPCGALAVVGPRCKRCGTDLRPVEDVVEDAIEVALSGGCKVEVCVGSADLDVLGRIGALLRF